MRHTIGHVTSQIRRPGDKNAPFISKSKKKTHTFLIIKTSAILIIEPRIVTHQVSVTSSSVYLIGIRTHRF